jgi:hydroxymethylpyrimidine pyrophosphatase-like HAD family hydrolase
MIEKRIEIPESETILSDLDNTLVEGGFNTNCSEIYEVISRIQSNGLKIGLSSDTPFEALEVWRDRFGMNGPIIAEKGAVVCTESGLSYNKEDSTTFTNTLETMINALSVKGFVIWEGNPVEALRMNMRIGNPGDRIALVNNLRKCSIGLFFRLVGQSGEMRTDQTITRLAMENIRNIYSNLEIDEDYNENHGLVIIARKGTNKRTGTQILMEDEGFKEVGMIGDSMSDYLGSDIAKHFAVQNAADKFKALSDYVAKERLTLGVVEILNKLLKTSEE